MRRALWIVLLISAAVPASAQAPLPLPTDEARRNASAHLGPFYITPTFQLKELGVDSNVFNEAGEPKSDFMFNLSPKADVWLAMARRALITTTVATDLVWFQTYDSERSIDPQASVRGELYLHRITLFAQDAYLNSRQRSNYEIDLRTRHMENNFEAGAEYRVTPKFSFSVSGRRAITRFEADAIFLGTSLPGNAQPRHHRLQRRDQAQAHAADDAAREGRAVHRRVPVVARARHRFDSRDAGGRVQAAGAGQRIRLRRVQEVHAEGRRGASGVQRPGREPRPVVHAARRDDVRRQLRARRELLVRGAAAVLRVERRRRVRPAGARPQVRRARSPPTAPSTPTATCGSGRRPPDSRRSTPGRTRPGTTRPAWATGPGRQTRVGFGASYWQRESTTVAFRDYDGLRIGTIVTYGF